MSISINTKRMYAESILSLCEEKPLEKVTIEDIIQRANTARQTFYNHFKDKYDLINFVYEYNSHQIMKKCHYYAWEECIKSRLDCCHKHKNFIISACRLDDYNNFKNFFFNHTTEYYKKYIVSKYGEGILTENLIYTINYHCYGSQGLVIDWINCGMKLPTKDLAKLIINCMPEELKQYVK